MPRYQDARDSLVYTVYTTSGLGDRDARFLADFLLSAGTQVPEGGGNILRELTAAHGPFVDARDKVACISLALAFGQWLTTEQGKSGVRNILGTYVETPAGLVASPRYLDAVRSQFPATPADRTELFDAQIKPRRAWQEQIEELMREQRRRFQEPLTRFDQTAVDAFGELLGRACAERLTFAQFQDRITRL